MRQNTSFVRSRCSCLKGDYLKLFLHLDGGQVNEYTPWETLLCGGLADIPTVLYSSGPGLVLEFHSGVKTSNATGFSGTFRFMDRSKCVYIVSIFTLILRYNGSVVKYLMKYRFYCEFNFQFDLYHAYYGKVQLF